MSGCRHDKAAVVRVAGVRELRRCLRCGTAVWRELAEGAESAAAVQLAGETSVFRPAVNYRNGVAFLSCRRWLAGERRGYEVFRESKLSLDYEYLWAMAADVVRMVEDAGLAFELVTAPPWGVAAREHFASVLARMVAVAVGRCYVRAFRDRIRTGKSHHPKTQRAAAELRVIPNGPVLVVDDIATSGATMVEALATLRAADVRAVGCAWVYGERHA